MEVSNGRIDIEVEVEGTLKPKKSREVLLVMADKTPILTLERALKIIMSFGVKTAGNMSNEGKAIKALLDEQLAKAEPYYIEKGRQMERERIFELMATDMSILDEEYIVWVEAQHKIHALKGGKDV